MSGLTGWVQGNASAVLILLALSVLVIGAQIVLLLQSKKTVGKRDRQIAELRAEVNQLRFAKTPPSQQRVSISSVNDGFRPRATQSNEDNLPPAATVQQRPQAIARPEGKPAPAPKPAPPPREVHKPRVVYLGRDDMSGKWDEGAIFEECVPRALFVARQVGTSTRFTYELVEDDTVRRRIIARPGDFTSKVMSIRITGDGQHLEVETSGKLEATGPTQFRVVEPLRVVLT